MGTLGRHYLLDLKECNKDRLDDVEFIKDVLAHVAREAGTSVIGESFHRFEPQGLSGAVLITGAHLCIHTWPEYGYAAIDIFLHGCPKFGRVQPDRLGPESDFAAGPDRPHTVDQRPAGYRYRYR